jgi:hypothetical protein
VVCGTLNASSSEALAKEDGAIFCSSTTDNQSQIFSLSDFDKGGKSLFLQPFRQKEGIFPFSSVG